MDDIEAAIGECARKLREHAPAIRGLTTEMCAVQSQLGHETSRLSTLTIRRAVDGDIAQSLAEIRLLSCELAGLSDRVSSVDLWVRLEIALMKTLVARRRAAPSPPISWEWLLRL